MNHLTLRIQLAAERERVITAALVGITPGLLELTLKDPSSGEVIASKIGEMAAGNTWKSNLIEIDKLIKLAQA